MNKYCTKCGNAISQGEKFCTNCGQTTDVQTSKPLQSPAPQNTGFRLPIANTYSVKATTSGKITVASFAVLSLLFGFLASIILLFLYSIHIISVGLVIFLTIIVNIIFWLLGPSITDWVNKFFYQVQFFNQEQLRQSAPWLEKFIAEIAMKQKIPFPKIGYINDDNPIAYTYGSAAFNARMILTKGLWTYLAPEEVDSVVAHELGHIVHRDFIVMAIANTILQLLYEIYYLTFHSRRSSRDDKGGGYLALIGLLAYIFYQIGFYLVLFLSRLRESYADEFSAIVTGQPNLLSNALVKIAYGIVAKEETPQSTRLLQSTRTLGIMGFRTAQRTGAVVKAAKFELPIIARALLYDIVSPWAKISEFFSTHPLTGKRLLLLDKLAISMGIPPRFNMTEIIDKEQVDKKALWGHFWVGVLFGFMPTMLIVNTAFAALLGFILGLAGVSKAIGIAIGAWLLFFASASLIRALYRYPNRKPERSDVLTLMNNLYASPVRGIPVQMEGKAVGRGQAGFVFSADLIMQDVTGIIYLHYTSILGALGNLFFAWRKVKDLIGQTVNVQGWFFRSNTQLVIMQNLDSNGKQFKSYARFWTYLSAVVIALVVGPIAIILMSKAIVNSFPK